MDMVTDDTIAPVAFGEPEPEPEVLSYDEAIPYENQVEPESDPSSLANRIGRGKIYLLADTASSSVRPRKTDDPEDEAMMEEDEDISQDSDIRSNALFFTGPPISFLPTARIFAYATHFDARPLGLEWVSDTTCVVVFSSNADAKKAYRVLQKNADEDPSIDDGSVTAKPIPVPIWPADERISRTLGLALGNTAPTSEEHETEKQRRKDGLSAPLRMRWARKDDVKKRGARKESEFYRKHGVLAGKETVNGRDIPTISSTGRKRRRDDEDSEELTRARLDQELDEFLAADDDTLDEGEPSSSARTLAERFSTTADDSNPDSGVPSPPVSPPSKMRSDYIADDGRTRLQRSSVRAKSGSSSSSRRRGPRDRRPRYGDTDDRAGSLSLSDRIRSADSPRWVQDGDRDLGPPERKRQRGGRSRQPDRSGSPARGGGGDRGGDRRRQGGRTEPRPKKTQQELDDELDAFLNQG